MDVNSRDSDRNTGLMLAICYTKTKVVNFLLDRPDVDINAANNAGLTALHLACQAGDLGLVARLAGDPRMVGLNARAVWGETAVMGAAARGQGEVVRLLASCRAGGIFY
jgi:ankyrin repeat protein